MSVREKARHIGVELRGHAPFTLFGALLGIFFMLLFRSVSGASGRTLFSIFHPGHVVLSAMVTASMLNVHAAKKRIILVVLVGYFGSVGIATLSDVIIPHVGTHLLGLDIPTHAVLHDDDNPSPEHEEDEHHEHGIHLGFIEEWYIVNPAALLGIVIAYFLPRTKFPHAGHVLISTWASSSYMLMNMESGMTAGVVAGMFVILFLAIWVPCCISDIIFPLLFVKSDIEMMGPCPVHERHSHPHTDKDPEDHK
jgi:hypothetical protein